MRIYLAGVRDSRAKRVCSELGVRNYLLSFSLGQRAFDQNSDVLDNPECRLMVDSGAFSVWNSGRKIDIKKYADFAHKLMARARCELIFVNLDDIPGRKNAPVTSHQRDISSEQSFRNWEYLRAQGVPSMGVFHQHERFYWLDELKKHSGYIGISPANDVSVEKRDGWLSQVFQWIGLSVKTHGFGLTASRLLRKYPFFSADSSTWMSGVKYGSYVSMNWKKLGIDQLTRRQFQANLERVAKDLVPFVRTADYKFRVAVREFLTYERFLTDLWERRFSAPESPPLISLGLKVSGPVQFDNHKIDSKAVPIELIRWLGEIKGARLTVWLAHLMDADHEGMTDLSVKWLERLTGLHDDTITDARSWLMGNGWLVPQSKMGRNQGRFAPKKLQVLLPLKPRSAPAPSL